jgi:SAM-dependent methyltransferase
MLLNVGCGDWRPKDPWINIDNLYNAFPEGHPERSKLIGRLDLESNYINHDITTPWPFENESVDGIVMSHVLEHFVMKQAIDIMVETRRVLKPGGVLRINVPDASYFRQVYSEDNRNNWTRLFEIADDVSSNEKYFQVALFYHEHEQVYTEDTLWCQLVRAGFSPDEIGRTNSKQTLRPSHYCSQQLLELDNRIKFSLFFEAYR